MGIFYNIMLGYFFGFALGVGCALAVFYAIYSGGYRKAVEHGLQQQKPKRYLEEMAAAIKRADRDNAEKEKAQEKAQKEKAQEKAQKEKA